MCFTPRGPHIPSASTGHPSPHPPARKGPFRPQDLGPHSPASLGSRLSSGLGPPPNLPPQRPGSPASHRSLTSGKSPTTLKISCSVTHHGSVALAFYKHREHALSADQGTRRQPDSPAPETIRQRVLADLHSTASSECDGAAQGPCGHRKGAMDLNGGGRPGGGVLEKVTSQMRSGG